MIIQPWVVSLFVSAGFSGLAGALLTMIYILWDAQQAAKAKQKGTIAALAGELRCSNFLCGHNANLR